MSCRQVNPEEVEKRLQTYFRAEEREMEVPLPMWERLSPRLGEQKRARRLLRIPLDEVSLARRGKLYGVLASLLGLIILAGVLYAPRPWGGGSLTPATVFAAALDDLLKVESVHVVVEQYRPGSWSFAFPRLDVLGIDPKRPEGSVAAILAHIEFDCPGNCKLQIKYDCLEQDGTSPGNCTFRIEYDCPEQEGTSPRVCIIRKKGTGEEVGRAEKREVRTITEGNFLPPDTYHYWTDNGYDNPLMIGGPNSYEYLYVDDRLYGRMGRDGQDPWGGYSYWRPIYLEGSKSGWSQTFFWGLFDQSVEGEPALPSLLDGFDSVERLPDTELDGLLVEHYQAERSFDDGGSEVVELWLSKEDRLARKLTRKGGPRGWWPDTYSWDSTYTFSNFNEPVMIPDPWEDAP